MILRLHALVPALLLFSVVALLATGCGNKKKTLGGMISAVYGEASMPALFLTDGMVDYSNPFNPVTGEDITDATVTFTNEDTSNSVVLNWTAPSGNMERGSYGGYTQDFPHAAGESVSVTIERGDDMVSGGPTVTPDSTVTLTAPVHESTASLPMDITWDVTEGSYPATHCFVFINADDNSDAYMDVVPLSQGTYTITASHISTTGPHHVTVWPTTPMPLSGAEDASSVVQVKSTELSYSHAVTLE